MNPPRVLEWLAASAVVMAALAAGGCKSAAACASAPASSLLGSWSYTATQTSPTTASLSGILQISSECAQGFSGTLDVTQVDAQGRTQRLTGAVNGSVVDPTVDFDAFLDATPRRHLGHLGALRSDSMGGNWLEPTDAGTLSGSFTSVRTSAP